MTKVVNLKYDKYDIYIGRGHGSIFGNPYVIGKDGTRKEVIRDFSIYFYGRMLTDYKFKNEVLKLKNKILGCFCSPLPCHGDIIAEYLDKEEKI